MLRSWEKEPTRCPSPCSSPRWAIAGGTIIVRVFARGRASATGAGFVRSDQNRIVRLRRLVARGFRNLADLDVRACRRGGVALLGANAQGKTNLLEAIYYPVLFRSVRGAPDQEVAPLRRDRIPRSRPTSERGDARHSVAQRHLARAGRRKRIVVDGEEPRADGRRGRASGSRSRFCRTTSTSRRDPRPDGDAISTGCSRWRTGSTCAALARYRAALAQRNSALRQGRPDVARAFDVPLGRGRGAVVTRPRSGGPRSAAEQFAAGARVPRRAAPGHGSGTGEHAELADAGGWPAALGRGAGSRPARGMTTVGPHRDDLVLEIGGRPLREFGSTGQQRSAAVALKLVELVSLRAARGTEPALLLDDVFAELDRERQRRLARRLLGNDDAPGLRDRAAPDELPPEPDVAGLDASTRDG